jgi:peptide chain release factor subunit 1
LFSTLSGTSKTILTRFSVDLPKKHSRGGQSALRFSRLRDEARHNFIRKVAETAADSFLKDNVVNVQGLILAGSADLKTDLQSSDLFPRKLQEKVLQVVDCEYGGQNGFNQAIEASANVLGEVKMVQEKKILKKYFEEIAMDNGKVSYGIMDTIKALEMGAVESLIVFEDLDTSLVGHDIFSGEQKVHESSFLFGENGENGQERVLLTEWLAENHHRFGIQLVYVSDSSSEGDQFVKGLGGIGALLRWKVDLDELDEFEEMEENGVAY